MLLVVNEALGHLRFTGLRHRSRGVWVCGKERSLWNHLYCSIQGHSGLVIGVRDWMCVCKIFYY